MTLWHANTELLTTATVAAKTVYTAATLEAGAALGLSLEPTAHVEPEMARGGLSGTSDTSG